MYFCYTGLLMVTVIFVFCLGQSLKQWHKGEMLQREQIQNADSESGRYPRHTQLGSLEQDCRGYALACLIAAAIAAIVELIAGGIIWAYGG